MPDKGTATLGRPAAIVLSMELEHLYGDHVHILDDPYLLSLLARVGSPETGTQALPALVRSTYARLCAEVLARIDAEGPGRSLLTGRGSPTSGRPLGRKLDGHEKDHEKTDTGPEATPGGE